MQATVKGHQQSDFQDTQNFAQCSLVVSRHYQVRLPFFFSISNAISGSARDSKALLRRTQWLKWTLQ